MSYPLGPRMFLTCFCSGAHDRALNSLVQDPHADVLLLFGDRDEFTAIEKYETWAAKLKETGGYRVQVSCVKGAGHFWSQRTSAEMLRNIGQWLSYS